MKRLALIFPLLAATVLPLEAQDFSAGAIESANPYRDLPGVKAPKTGASSGNDGFDCRSEIDASRYDRRDRFGRRTDSAIIYSCSRNGVTVESERAPRRGWLPGQPQYGWPWGE